MIKFLLSTEKKSELQIEQKEGDKFSIGLFKFEILNKERRL